MVQTSRKSYLTHEFPTCVIRVLPFTHLKKVLWAGEPAKYGGSHGSSLFWLRAGQGGRKNKCPSHSSPKTAVSSHSQMTMVFVNKHLWIQPHLQGKPRNRREPPTSMLCPHATAKLGCSSLGKQTIVWKDNQERIIISSLLIPRAASDNTKD